MKEVVIKMPDAVYDWFVNGFPDRADLDELQRLVINGTVLPAGHGELKDADELHNEFADGTEGYDFAHWCRTDICKVIDDARTVIEADKENRYEG